MGPGVATVTPNADYEPTSAEMFACFVRCVRMNPQISDDDARWPDILKAYVGSPPIDRLGTP